MKPGQLPSSKLGLLIIMVILIDIGTNKDLGFYLGFFQKSLDFDLFGRSRWRFYLFESEMLTTIVKIQANF